MEFAELHPGLRVRGPDGRIGSVAWLEGDGFGIQWDADDGDAMVLDYPARRAQRLSPALTESVNAVNRRPPGIGPDDLERRLSWLLSKAVRGQGIVGVAAWTAFLDEVQSEGVAQRALMVADLLFLYAWSAQAVATYIEERNGQSWTGVGVQEWVNQHGPRRYAVLTKVGDGAASVRWVPVTGAIQTRRELTFARNEGSRVVPAQWQITPDTHAAADSRSNPWQLWLRIENEAPELAAPVKRISRKKARAESL